VKTWGLPPQAKADFGSQMADVLRGDPVPDDRHAPGVCRDEARQQLMGEVNAPVPRRSGRIKCEAYADERNGVCNQVLCGEPRRGGRHVRVTVRRTKRDWAECIRELVAGHYPHAPRMRLGLDHLNTPTGASLDEACPPAEARRFLDRVECHHTPKHASWLTMAASDIGVLTSQGLERRLDHVDGLRSAISAWAGRRHHQPVKIPWSFPIAVARHKLKNLYPVLENSNPPKCKGTCQSKIARLLGLLRMKGIILESDGIAHVVKQLLRPLFHSLYLPDIMG
jgi:hypothetical protein